MDELSRGSGSFADSRRRPGRVGVALPAALLMILLIAALVAGVFSAITEETRIGVAASERQLALLAAESAAELTVASLSAFVDSIGIGETRSRSVEGLAPPTMVYVTRLDSSRYWVVADAASASPNSGIARRVGVVVRAATAADGSMTIDRISERAWSELF